MTKMSFMLHNGFIKLWFNPVTKCNERRPQHYTTIMTHSRLLLRSYLTIGLLVLTVLFCMFSDWVAEGSDAIESAGDVLQYVLPATAAGLTLGYKDGKGA